MACLSERHKGCYLVGIKGIEVRRRGLGGERKCAKVPSLMRLVRTRRDRDYVQGIRGIA
jgi:hypothetical protein